MVTVEEVEKLRAKLLWTVEGDVRGGVKLGGEGFAEFQLLTTANDLKGEVGAGFVSGRYGADHGIDAFIGGDAAEVGNAERLGRVAQGGQLSCKGVWRN